MYRLLYISILILLPGCTYGPVYTLANIGNAIAKPHSHIFTVSVDYTRVKDPTGINAFPNGKVKKVMYEKSVYISVM